MPLQQNSQVGSSIRFRTSLGSSHLPPQTAWALPLQKTNTPDTRSKPATTKRRVPWNLAVLTSYLPISAVVPQKPMLAKHGERWREQKLVERITSLSVVTAPNLL